MMAQTKFCIICFNQPCSCSPVKVSTSDSSVIDPYTGWKMINLPSHITVIDNKLADLLSQIEKLKAALTVYAEYYHPEDSHNRLAREVLKELE